MIDIIMKYINGFTKPQEATNYMPASVMYTQNKPDVVFSSEPAMVRLTPVLPPYKYNNTVNGIQFNSQ